MSALPPKADIPQHCLDVRFGPQADIVKLPELAEVAIGSAELIVQAEAALSAVREFRRGEPGDVSAMATSPTGGSAQMTTLKLGRGLPCVHI
jgi:hypothetical protein